MSEVKADEDGRYVPGAVIGEILAAIKSSGGWDDLDDLKQAWRAAFPQDVMYCGQNPFMTESGWQRCDLDTDHAGPCALRPREDAK